MTSLPNTQPIDNIFHSPLRQARARAMHLFLEHQDMFFIERDLTVFVERGWTAEQVGAALDDLVRAGKVKLCEEFDERDGVSIVAWLVEPENGH